MHNRVESIVSIAERIRSLVPDARVGVGHAQLSDEGLEQVMLATTGPGESDEMLSSGGIAVDHLAMLPGSLSPAWRAACDEDSGWSELRPT